MAAPMHIQHRSRRSTRGFTLIELMVAMAIFVTVLSGVTLLFNSAIRTSKQGFQNQEAYEIARGLFNIIERDLSRMYIAREMGYKHTFYGTPYGITFIGMITSEDGGTPNLARFTYVIHREANHKILNAVVTEDNENLPEDELIRNTYSLIRYVEPGVDSLDSFPIDWKRIMVSQDIGGGGASVTLEQHIADSFFTDITTRNLFVNFADPLDNETLCAEEDSNCREAIVRAAKRELWLRMLSARVDEFGRTDDPDFTGLPDLWALLGEDPEDYVIAENLLFVDQAPDPSDNSRLIVAPKFSDPTIDLSHIALISHEPITGPDSINSTYSPAVPGTPRTSPTDYFFAYRTYGETNRRLDPQNPLSGAVQKVRQDGTLAVRSLTAENGNPNAAIWETEFTGIDFGYWNDFRNLEYARNASRANSIEFENLTDIEEDERAQDLAQQFTAAGSPLTGDAPESIIVNVTLFFESVYAGAPDFQRTFSQIFETPSGYRRTTESLSTQLVRKPE